MLFTQLESSSDYDDEFKPIKKVNKYIIVGCVGEGTFAKVYYGVDSETGHEYALKKFKLGDLQTLDSGISQLEREIMMMRKLNHPNILTLHEVLYVEQKEIVYLVIDYADCGSLEKIIQKQWMVLNDDMIRGIFLQILNALKYLGSLGIIHEDIKPSNILISSNGKAYLSDFGVGHTTASFDMVVGSPAYQAPECFQDGVDYREMDPAKEDVWSLGVTLYQTLFGKLPFEGENVFEIVAKIKTTPLPIPDGTDPVKVSLLKGMLCINQLERFNVTRTIQHEFFMKSDGKFNADNIKQVERPKINQKAQMVQINAKVCDDSFSFARPTFTVHAQLRAMNSKSNNNGI